MTQPATSDNESNPFPTTPLAEKLRVVAVTGAGRGIGRELVTRLCAEGYRVAALSRSMPELPEIGEARAYALDVADADAIARVFAEIEQDLGPVDGLVANAAIYERGWFLDQDAASFDRHLAVNVAGVANAIRAVLPGMLERNFGRVVVMGSLADMNPAPGSVAYSVSKGALHALVKGIAAEIDPARYGNVLINECNPGATRTGMSEAGNDPSLIPSYVLPLLRAGAGSASGRLFLQGREIRPGEGFKAKLKRALLRR